jgi:hypothetical protein
MRARTDRVASGRCGHPLGRLQEGDTKIDALGSTGGDPLEGLGETDRFRSEGVTLGAAIEGGGEGIGLGCSEGLGTIALALGAASALDVASALRDGLGDGVAVRDRPPDTLWMEAAMLAGAVIVPAAEPTTPAR